MFFKQYLKLLSYTYIFFLSLFMLIPLDSYIIKSIIAKENHPTNITSFVIHFILFFFLYFILRISFKNNHFLIIFSTSYSIIIEFLQIISNRGFQLFDIVFNLIGIFSAYVFLIYFHKKIKNRLNL